MVSTKKAVIIAISITILIILGLFIFRGSEDNWIMDEKGIWIKHGNPSITPDYVEFQQTAIKCARDLKDIQKIRGIGLKSECLGSCYDYVVDVVSVPRIAEDNLPENQCRAYLNGTLQHFIEIDKEGNIVRIV